MAVTYCMDCDAAGTIGANCYDDNTYAIFIIGNSPKEDGERSAWVGQGNTVVTVKQSEVDRITAVTWLDSANTHVQVSYAEADGQSAAERSMGWKLAEPRPIYIPESIAWDSRAGNEFTTFDYPGEKWAIIDQHHSAVVEGGFLYLGKRFDTSISALGEPRNRRLDIYMYDTIQDGDDKNRWPNGKTVPVWEMPLEGERRRRRFDVNKTIYEEARAAINTEMEHADRAFADWEDEIGTAWDDVLNSTQDSVLASNLGRVPTVDDFVAVDPTSNGPVGGVGAGTLHQWPDTSVYRDENGFSASSRRGR